MSIVVPSLRGILSVPSWARNPLWKNAAAVPSLDLRFADNKSLIDAVSNQNLITFTRASEGTFVNSQGLIQTAAINVPRFDHNPTTGESLGLLVEESRTNLLLRSEEFDNASWGLIGSVVSVDAIASPSGAVTSDLLREDAFNGIHEIYQAGTSGASTYTLSLFFKNGTGTRHLNLSASRGASDWISCRFNLANGTASAVSIEGSSFTSASAQIASRGDGWYRGILTFTSSGSFATQIALSSSSAAPASGSFGVEGYQGDNASGIYLWGAQLEAGAFPTSYIKTEASAATRAADVASISGSNFASWYRQDEHTAFVDFSNEATAGSDRRLLNFVEASGFGVNGASLFVSNAAQRAASFNNFVASANIGRFDSSISLSARARRRAAFSFAASSRVLCVDGEAPVVSTNAFTPPSNIISAAFGSDGLGTGHINGHVRRLTYWPQRLGNEVLQRITQ